MNDIERYNFWHSEMDAFVRKEKENQAVVDFAKRMGKPFEHLKDTTIIWEKNIGKTNKGA